MDDRFGNDAFWDLVPPQKEKGETVPRKDTSTVEIHIGGDRPLRKLPSSRVFTLRQEKESPKLLLSYEPKDSMLRAVRVYAWPERYGFYEDFLRDAHRYFPERGVKTPPLPFFAYTPQYSHLTRAQLAYYLYFRTQIREEGQYPPADFSYVMLLIYEILNLPDLIPPARGAELLGGIWYYYRETYRQLDKYLGEWLCDYCLIHRVAPPQVVVREIVPQLGERVALREFYTDFEENLSGSATAFLASPYQYRNSRYYKENSDLFDRHITGALDEAFARMKEDGTSPLTDFSLMRGKITRDAYCGAVCAMSNKRKLEIEYLSFSRSPEFRETVGLMVKYAENRVRAHLHIKSRLGARGAGHWRTYIDDYFAKHLPAPTASASSRASREPVDTSYERFYDAPPSTLKITSAAAIEADSWGTTELLNAAFDEEQTVEIEPIVPKKTPEPPAPPAPAPAEDDLFEGRMTPFYREALRAAAEGRFPAYCREASRLADAVLDEINEIAAETMGDIVLDADHTILEDYKEEVLSWICKTQ